MTERTTTGITFMGVWTSLWSVPSGRWPSVRWGLALLLPIAVILWILSVFIAPDGPDILTIRAMSQVTGEWIEGATVTVDESRYATDSVGEIRIAPIEPGTPITVSAVGYETMRRDLDEDHGWDLTISLSGILVLGSLTDSVSGEPIAGADISAVGAGGDELAASRTDEVGGFVFKLIPEDARLQIDDKIYGVSDHPIDGRRSVQIQLDPPPVSGRVVDDAGQPVDGAIVIGPNVQGSSGPDGVFVLQPVGQGSELEISAEEYGATTVLIEGSDVGDVVLPALPATPSPQSGGGA